MIDKKENPIVIMVLIIFTLVLFIGTVTSCSSKKAYCPNYNYSKIDRFVSIDECKAITFSNDTLYNVNKNVASKIVIGKDYIIDIKVRHDTYCNIVQKDLLNIH